MLDIKDSAQKATETHQAAIESIRQQLADLQSKKLVAQTDNEKAQIQARADKLGASLIRDHMDYLQKIDPAQANQQFDALAKSAYGDPNDPDNNPGDPDKAAALEKVIPTQLQVWKAGLPVFGAKAVVPAKAPVIQPPKMSVIDKGGGEKATNYYNLPTTFSGAPAIPQTGGTNSPRSAIIRRPGLPPVPLTY